MLKDKNYKRVYISAEAARKLKMMAEVREISMYMLLNLIIENTKVKEDIHGIYTDDK